MSWLGFCSSRWFQIKAVLKLRAGLKPTVQSWFGNFPAWEEFLTANLSENKYWSGNEWKKPIMSDNPNGDFGFLTKFLFQLWKERKRTRAKRKQRTTQCCPSLKWCSFTLYLHIWYHLCSMKGLLVRKQSSLSMDQVFPVAN